VLTRSAKNEELRIASPTGFCGQVGLPPNEAAMSKLWHQLL